MSLLRALLTAIGCWILLNAFLGVNVCQQYRHKVRFQSAVKLFLADTPGKKLAGGQSLSLWHMFKWRKKLGMGWEWRDAIGMDENGLWAVLKLTQSQLKIGWGSIFPYEYIVWTGPSRKHHWLWRGGWTHGQNLVSWFGVLKTLLTWKPGCRFGIEPLWI